MYQMMQENHRIIIIIIDYSFPFIVYLLSIKANFNLIRHSALLFIISVLPINRRSRRFIIILFII